jgi:parvulin-like peptidyl-prolyl isomerase
MATMKDPEQEELQAYYQANKNKYLLPQRFSFSHIYFNPDKRVAAKQDAQTVLTTLPATDKNLDELVRKGDAFAFSYHVDSLTEKEIARELGDDFANSLQGLPIKKWSGPVLSGFGAHLIFINEIKDAAEPSFAMIKDAVLRDYQYNLQEQYNNQLLGEFKKDFTIRLNIKDAEQNKQISQLIGANVNK